MSRKDHPQAKDPTNGRFVCARTAPPSPPAPAAGDWRMVPCEPDAKMREAGSNAYHNTGDWLATWEAMILASPPAPVPAELPERVFTKAQEDYINRFNSGALSDQNRAAVDEWRKAALAKPAPVPAEGLGEDDLDENAIVVGISELLSWGSLCKRDAEFVSPLLQKAQTQAAAIAALQARVAEVEDGRDMMGNWWAKEKTRAEAAEQRAEEENDFANRQVSEKNRLELALSAAEARAEEAESALMEYDCYGTKHQKARADVAEARAARMAGALEPFVAVDGEGVDNYPDDMAVELRCGRSTYYMLLLGHFRAARAALRESGTPGGTDASKPVSQDD